MYILRNVIHRFFEAAGDDGAAAGGAGGEGGAPDPAAVEQRAREMGWAPKEQWRGNPDNWIDASTFVQRGEQVMPILQANLRKRDVQVTTLQQQIQERDRRLAAAEEAISVLTNLSTEQGRKDAKEKRRELLRAQAEARSEGDTDREIELGEQIADVTSQINAAETKPAAAAPASGKPGKAPVAGAGGTPSATTDPTTDPAYQAFTQENPWFGTDNRKTVLATEIGRELRNDPANNHLQGKAFFDKVVAEVNKVFTPPRSTTSKVESGTGNGAATTRGNDTDPASGKSYADLPDDAKAACDRFAKTVVGEGKTFKDMTAWRKHYVTQYFNS